MLRTSCFALAVSAILGSALAATAPALATEATQVVALWHLDETSGTTMVDSGPLGNHDGIINPNVVLGVAGDPDLNAADRSYIGTGYEFTGLNPLVRIPATLATDLNPGLLPLIVSAHLRVPATLGAGDYNVLQKGQATAVGGAYKLEIVGKTTSAKFGYPDCAFNSPGVKQRPYGPKPINDGQWHIVQCHLTDTQAWVTVDGAKGLIQSRTVGSISNASDVTLGGKPNNTHYFNGVADEVSISIG